jgi:DNA-binding XRE family transcriptional regulator
MAGIGFVSPALEAWREERQTQIGRVLRSSVVCLAFGQRIHNLRMLLGWSQREAALHFGVSVRTVIRHERREGRRPSLELLLGARALEEAHAEEIIALMVQAERAELSAGSDPSVGTPRHACRFCYRQLVS